METTVKIKLAEGARPPQYMTSGSAGADLSAHLPQPITLAKGESLSIPTGVFLEIPNGFEAQIRPRSGLALRNGITVLNAPGTIDSDYRGELRVLLINHGASAYTIENGDRIAQLVIAPVIQAHFLPQDTLTPSTRNLDGFGHTGKS